YSLRERVRDRDTLSVAAERKCVQIVRIRVPGCRGASLARPFGRFLEECESRFCVGLDVIRVDALRLDGSVDAGISCRASRRNGLLKRSSVEVPPCTRDIRVLRKGLAVAAMQTGPRLLECGTRVRVGWVRMRKLRPLFRHVHSSAASKATGA